VAQLELQAWHLSIPESKVPATQAHPLAMSLLVSAQVSQTRLDLHVAHFDGHAVHTPLFSKKPAVQPHVLSSGFRAAPVKHVVQMAVFKASQTEQSLA